MFMVTNASCPAHLSGVIEIPLMAAVPGCYLYSISCRPAGSAGKTVQNFPSFLPFHSISKRDSDPEAHLHCVGHEAKA